MIAIPTSLPKEAKENYKETIRHLWKKSKMTETDEKYIVFLDQKKEHCENDYTAQSNLQVQCNAFQITTGIFHRNGTKNFTIHMETQKTLNSQSNLKKEKQS